ncbi:MAG TPA: permease prefix domain 1-containing protein [Bryobacteraceae bacterium]|nr:permease prefix domain 1-containing protein [Bryobacteraceae bacterium]
MSVIHLLSVWRRHLFHGDRVERELDDELQSYRDLLAEEKVQTGSAAETARREALLDMGGLEQVKEEWRDVRRLRWLDVPRQDVSYGLRLLGRNPGFTATAVITLSLGIGATTAIFAVVNGVLLRPLPYPQPDRLVYIKEDFGRGAPAIFSPTGHHLAWNRQATTLSRMAAYVDLPANLSGGGEPERIVCGMATASFFPLLGVKALLGRTLLPADDSPGAARPVLPRIIGRLKPGVNLETARAELDANLRATLRPGQKNRVVVTKWHEEIAGGV